MSCEQARNLLVKDGGSRTEILLASGRMVHCGDMAPTTFVVVLRTATRGSVRDSVVKHVAWLLSDRRLLDSVIALSRESGIGVAGRTMALGLLTHYADMHASLLPGLQHEPMPLVIAHEMHGDYILGSVPMDAADQDRAFAAIWHVARNEPDHNLRLLARRAAEQLGLRRGIHTDPR